MLRWKEWVLIPFVSNAVRRPKEKCCVNRSYSMVLIMWMVRSYDVRPACHTKLCRVNQTISKRSSHSLWRFVFLISGRVKSTATKWKRARLIKCKCALRIKDRYTKKLISCVTNLRRFVRKFVTHCMFSMYSTVIALHSLDPSSPFTIWKPVCVQLTFLLKTPAFSWLEKDGLWANLFLLVIFSNIAKKV